MDSEIYSVVLAHFSWELQDPSDANLVETDSSKVIFRRKMMKEGPREEWFLLL